MPYLQLEVNQQYPVATKKLLAKRLGDIFSEIMQADVNRVTVTIRELDGGVWRCGDADPNPSALLMCDIRRGRTPEKREEVAKKLIAACVEILGEGADLLNVEFTQHAGDEMYHPTMGGLSDDWNPGER
ncbi:tautomerase family protein [Mucilaginibacter sp. FT3.2]|uniref:tautomerase family protein n=1 Tax=Mucilaginibacter sp. FT3.2 TaxID=2723090 RepID=UPI00160EF925|nr:tautomerase [Mucilaginibacter sp. FT3.2]MBB6233699.1 phenylpyruvate tautomerase PptA (4-oxalocrotonate tautomerase family) [Mucilaginibacter sp. FT3.2]